MSTQRDPSFEFDYRLATDLKIKQDWAARLTADSMRDFVAKLPGWRAQVLFAQQGDQRALGTPIPAPPAPPMAYSIDEAKHREIATDRILNNRDAGLEYDWAYVNIVPAQLPEGAMDLTPKNPHTPKPQPLAANPIGRPYPQHGPGVFRHVGSVDEWEDGDTHTDRETRKRYSAARLRVSPFNQTEKRFLWLEEGVGQIDPDELYVY